MRRAVFVAAAVALAMVGGVPAQAAAPARAFTVSAAAFPVEPAPGTNETSLGIRPASTQASLGNPPATAYGRAAAYDLGSIELYTGPPPPDTVAECDTGSPNIPDDSTAAPGDMKLTATCGDRPVATATAAGRSYAAGDVSASSVASRASADGGTDTVTTEAVVTVQGILSGPLAVQTVTTQASTRANGEPGGAAAVGRVTASGATVNGTPVVIGPDGVSVDRERVPLELVGPAMTAVRDALAQGGYTDVRVVQPRTEASPDGTRALVRGGGVMLFFTNNEPGRNYFLRVTFGGVALSTEIGPAVGSEGAPPGPVRSAPPAVLSEESGVPLSAPGGQSPVRFAPGTPGSPGAPAAVPAPPVLTAGRRTYDLPEPWKGWPTLVALSAALAIGGWLARRRLLGWWALNADRYLRG